MSIQFSCPNGHVLTVKDSWVGRKGVCPACKAPVEVPTPAAEPFEDEVLGFLGAYDPGRYKNPAAVRVAEVVEQSGIFRAGSVSTTPLKSCTRCHQTIEAGTHVCPHCHTYIAGISDFRST